MWIWKFVANHIAEKQLTGWGFDASRQMPNGSQSSIVGNTNLPLHPHDAVLQIWLELGVPGAILLAVLLVLAFRAAEARDDDRVVSAALVAHVAATLSLIATTYGIWQSWWLVAVGSGAAFAAASAQLGAVETSEQRSEAL